MSHHAEAMSDLVKDKLKKYNNQRGIVYCLHDYDTVYSQSMINVLTDMHEEGFSLEKIAEELHRAPVEILIALIHQAENGKVTRPFAIRR